MILESAEDYLAHYWDLRVWTVADTHSLSLMETCQERGAMERDVRDGDDLALLY